VRSPVAGPLPGRCRQGTRSPLCPQGRCTAIARTVPLPRFLAEQITASFARKGPNDLLFQDTRGGVLDNNNFNRRTFGPAAIAIGEPQLTPHGLRHTAASLAIAAEGNVKVVQQMLGHATEHDTRPVRAPVPRPTRRRRGSSGRHRPSGCGHFCGLEVLWTHCNRRPEGSKKAPDLWLCTWARPGSNRRQPRRKRHPGDFLTCTFTLKGASDLHRWCRMVSAGDQRLWTSCGLFAD
jgi:hypothetical protein